MGIMMMIQLKNKRKKKNTAKKNFQSIFIRPRQQDRKQDHNDALIRRGKVSERTEGRGASCETKVDRDSANKCTAFP